VAEVRKLWLAGPAGRLEAALRVARGARGAAVLAHPHPLHGGTLDNPVVFHADRELHREGFTTLRFNFRGVGSSEGVHDDGRGEVDDLAAAARWLHGLAAGAPLVVVGYSFGGVCAVRHAPRDPAVAGVIGIGLPLRYFELRDFERLGRPLTVVQGSEDELGSPEQVRALLARARPAGELVLIDGAEHLFLRRAAEAGRAAALAALRQIG
jgi:alpha/beta superfamily hydrolase